MIAPNYLAGQVEAGIYPKKDQEKVCKCLWHSEGGIFVVQGGLTRMTCGVLELFRVLRIFVKVEGDIGLWDFEGFC